VALKSRDRRLEVTAAPAPWSSTRNSWSSSEELETTRAFVDILSDADQPGLVISSDISAFSALTRLVGLARKN